MSKAMAQQTKMLRGEGTVVEYYQDGKSIAYELRGQGIRTDVGTWNGDLDSLLAFLLEPMGLTVSQAKIVTMHSQNWGGKRSNAGRPRRYVRIPIHFHIATTEPAQLTPASDLSIYTAEMEEDGPRGIVIGDIWYGRDEALAIVRFVEEHKAWLQEQPASK